MQQNTVQCEDLRLLAEFRVPARIDARKVSLLLGFAEHDIPVLVSSRLLKPLGKPAPNSTKWFSTVEIMQLSTSPDWLDKATKRIGEYWKGKRLSKKSKAGAERTDMPSSAQT